ncbi:hypothetical protein [Bailinhaonella thermotolerans]|uniref:Uncharacterized protein n=1 Tax=Bailinhaonella thermotolerans TaxID=1070861 RepID=A0A3A4ARD1_9ACTN|nr:hypothetical protein [Bailinhaonella thermotolerans]RJL31661.1 hypothetical protein D5H75_18290 [Bailinhaonella thermotolerans]
MELKILNPQPRYRMVPFQEPSPNGYIHLAAAVRPPSGRVPRPGTGAGKQALLARLKTLAHDLDDLGDVVKATVYRAVVIPPVVTGYARIAAARPARYDVVVLVETATPDVIGAVEDSEPYRQMLQAVQGVTKDVHVMNARCARRLGDVDKNRQGLFLFNYFVAEDPGVALELWEHLAGWFVVETGLDNSTLLQPIGESAYTFVNHARWDVSFPRFAARAFAKPSFRSYVSANLLLNRTGSMPAFYRLA